MLKWAIRILSLAAAVGLVWWLYRQFFRDGLGATGFDDEGGLDAPAPGSVLGTTYQQSPTMLTHFDISEFDSPDAPGSGEQMQTSTLLMLDAARKNAGIPFRVNSGYRTPEHNASVGGVPDSAHTRGYAADIHAPDRDTQIKIVRAARAAGFTRFGLYDSFVHLDNDPAKPQNVAWYKKATSVQKGGNFAGYPFDPFTV